jgi:hypothetical protein
MGGPPGFDQPYPAPPPYGAPDQGGHDQFGATAFAPQGQQQQQGQPPPFGGAPPPPSPGGGFGPPPAPPPAAGMPPTNVMSGFDAGRGADAGKKPRRALAGFLVSFQDDPLGKFWPLYQGRNLVGRAETGQEVDVPIGHGTTSTNHATVEAEGGRLTLSDLGSTNGTFHNEEAIGFQGRRELRDGDKVRFGGFSVIVINVAARA